MGHFGFSYIGMIFLCMLFVPNIIWAGNRPKEYTAEHENKILLAFERTGEGLTCCCALLFSDFNLREMEAWAWWLAAAFFLMVLYEYWWIRYFHSRRSLEDFYSSLWGIPVAGATLPVMAFFLLGVYGKVVWMLAAALILGIGHIGIHVQHKREILRSNCKNRI